MEKLASQFWQAFRSALLIHDGTAILRLSISERRRAGSGACLRRCMAFCICAQALEMLVCVDRRVLDPKPILLFQSVVPQAGYGTEYEYGS